MSVYLTWYDAERIASDAKAEAMKLVEEFRREWNSTYDRARTSAMVNQALVDMSTPWSEMPEVAQTILRARAPNTAAKLDAMIGGTNGPEKPGT